MRLTALLALLAGCDLAFGLADTVPRERDRDGDGISDARDNCSGVPNADQADRDHDGIGDACDGCEFCAPCATPTNHDEDGDLLDDGCDNCPAQANPDQVNADEDDLGDACDHDNTTAQHRVLFDGFGRLSPVWVADSRWQVHDDTLVPLPPALQSEFQLWDPDA